MDFNNAITIEGWIFPTTVGGAYHDICSKWDMIAGPDQRSYATGLLPDSTFGFTLAPFGTTASTSLLQSTNTIPANQWTHFAGTYDGSSMKLYINGQLQNQVAYTLGIFRGTAALGIGATIGGGSPGQYISAFAGQIDELTLYKRALTAADVQGIFAAGAAGKCPNHPPIATNLIAATIQGRSMTIRTPKFLLAAFDPDGDPLTLSAVSSTTTNGGSATLNAGGVTYQPPAGFSGADRFTYAVNDGRGGTASAFVLIQVRSASDVSANMFPPEPAGSGFQVSFAGIPGYTYTLQRAPAVSGPWTTIASVLVGPNGIGTFTDTNPPAGSAFYRTVYP